MKIALIAPPFIAVPPADYGGTELFIAQLAEGLQKTGIEVVVYANGESGVNVERRHVYERSQWPIKQDHYTWLKELHHTSWAVQDAAQTCDVIHLQSAQGLACSRFAEAPMVCTLHGAHDPKLSEFYGQYPDVHYVCISEFQCRQETMPCLRTIHHGIDLSQYRLVETKHPYLSFIGRIAPLKGTHLAIEVAKRSGIPLKIAGDIQPMYREYFEAKIKPHLDGNFIEYIGLADLNAKNELLAIPWPCCFRLNGTNRLAWCWSKPWPAVHRCWRYPAALCRRSCVTEFRDMSAAPSRSSQNGLTTSKLSR